jgi:hypothetical protein
MTYYERNKEKCLAYQNKYNKVKHDEYLEYQVSHYYANKQQYLETSRKNRKSTGKPVGRPRVPKPIKEENTVQYVLMQPNKEPIITTKPITGYKITDKGFTFSDW